MANRGDEKRNRRERAIAKAKKVSQERNATDSVAQAVAEAAKKRYEEFRATRGSLRQQTATTLSESDDDADFDYGDEECEEERLLRYLAEAALAEACRGCKVCLCGTDHNGKKCGLTTTITVEWDGEVVAKHNPHLHVSFEDSAALWEESVRIGRPLNNHETVIFLTRA